MYYIKIRHMIENLKQLYMYIVSDGKIRSRLEFELGTVTSSTRLTISNVTTVLIQYIFRKEFNYVIHVRATRWTGCNIRNFEYLQNGEQSCFARYTERLRDATCSLESRNANDSAMTLRKQRAVYTREQRTLRPCVSQIPQMFAEKMNII